MDRPQRPDRLDDNPGREGQSSVDDAERLKELDFEHRRHLFGVARATLSLRYLRLAWRRMWTPTRPAAAAAVPHPPRETIAVTFVGHATVMVTTPKARLLTDPMLEGSLRGLNRAWAAAMHPGDLADVNLVLISGAGPDRLCPRTLARLPRSATLVVPSRCGAVIADLGFARVVELGAGQTFTFQDLEIASVPARHAGTRGWFGQRRRGASGYVIRTQGRSLYFAGATGYFPGFRDIGRRFDPDVALLPIAGYQPAPFRKQHLSPLDALYAFEDLGARVFIPITYGSFELSYEPIAEPLAWLRELARQRKLETALTVLENGQTCLIR